MAGKLKVEWLLAGRCRPAAERRNAMGKVKMAVIVAAMCAAAHADEVPMPPETQDGVSVGVLCALACLGVALLFVLVRKMHRKGGSGCGS